MEPHPPEGNEESALDVPVAGSESPRGGLRSRIFSIGDRTLAGVVSVAAFLAYLATMSWTAFPGVPTQSLLESLGWSPMPGSPALLWGGLVRLFVRGSRLPVAAWMGGIAALCGASCVYLVIRLMAHVGYHRWMAWTKSSQEKESQARRLSGLVAGLYLACSVPFWVASTRSLPATFHLWLLLMAAHVFSAYQRRGRLLHLGALGLLYGLGMVEFATFIVFLPLALALVGVELYRWRALDSWKAHAVFWGGMLAGGAGYPLHAFLLFRRGAFLSTMEALGHILQTQIDRIVVLRNHPAFMVVVFFCVAPWLLLFALSRRSPWFYEVPQVVVRLAFLGGLLALLFNATFSPWRMLGMHYLMVTPYLLFAICIGYMAGEFWILGEPPPPRSSWARRALRRASGVFAVLLPLVIVAGGARNGREADGRHGAFLQQAVHEILSRLGSRDVLYSAGALDGSLRLAIGEQRRPIRMITAGRTDSPVYLRYLSSLFTNDVLQRPLTEGDFACFQKNWMMSDGGIARTASVDMPDAFRAYARPVPDGLIYRLEPTGGDVDRAALLESQTSFWAWMEQMAGSPLPARSLARPYQDWLQAVAAKTANNLGVLLAEQGDEEGALRAFRAARRIRPENLSALMNLLVLARERSLPEADGLEAEWKERHEDLRADHWMLSSQHGYLWKASAWVSKGLAWALSGLPSNSGLTRMQEAAAPADVDLFTQWLDQAYLQWGAPPKDEWSFRARLGRNGKDAEALLELARLALRRQDPDTAEVYLAEALATGWPEAELRFDRAMVAAVRGERESAVSMLKELGRQTPGDLRVWSALLRLAEESDPVRLPAMGMLKSQPAGHVGIHLILAWEHLLKCRWKEAEIELDRVVQLNPRHRQAWELLVVLGQVKGNRRLVETGTRTLVAEDPRHPLGFIRRALKAQQRGQVDLAEAELQAGLRCGRNPDLLNVLADIRMAENADAREIRPLLDEAVAKRPFHPAYRCTRIDLELREGNLDAAWQELQVVRKAMPEFMPASLLSERVLAARSHIEDVGKLAERMKGWRLGNPPPKQGEGLEDPLIQAEERP